MRRREFISVLCGAVGAWPFRALAQPRVMPTIGYLSSYPRATNDKFVGTFREGLRDVGLVDGQDVTIEYRLAEQGQYDRLPEMAAELIGRRVAVLFATPIPAAIAAKSAVGRTPFVFAVGGDPVKMGLVASLNRPGGNATGATFLSVELTAKRLEILREIVPNVSSVALLVNPENPTTANQVKDTLTAAAAFAMHAIIQNVDTQTDLDALFASMSAQRIGAVVVSADSLFWGHREQLIRLGAQYSLPVMYFAREFVADGGLVSYASDYADGIRKAATYVGRILKGQAPGELPVLQPTKYELVINQRRAKALGLDVPPTLLATADEVIE